MVLPLIIGGFVYWGIVGDWLPIIRRGKQINFDSGISGSLRGQIKSYPGNRKMAIVAFEKTLVPIDYLTENQVTGWKNQMLDWFSGNVATVRVVGDDWQWQTIDDAECDNPNGAIRFRGNIWGESVNNSDLAVNMRMKEQSDTLRQVSTQLEEIELQMANITSAKYMDIDIASQKLKKIAENVKHVNFIAGKKVTNEADAMSTAG